MRTKLAVAALSLLLVASSPAFAVFINFDNEPANNSLATPDFLTSDPGINPPLDGRFATCYPASDVGLGSLAAPGLDNDFFVFRIPAGCVVTAIVTPLSPTFTNPTIVLQGGNTAGPFANGGGGGGNWINNLGGPPSNGGAIQFIANPGPDGLTVFNVADGAFVNPNIPPQVGNYALTISVVPEPASLALLAAGALALIRRRR